MELQQKQLMLIIDNIGLPSPSKTTVYDEVMSIWIKSMIMADRLISGMAQSVQSPEDLFGLCVWHIYPDIHAIGIKATTIEQKDNLVAKGGLLTIGLRSAGEEGVTGVSWSMPLAHLRFYGKPVMSHASIGSTSSRVPFHRGMHIVLGALTSEWQSSMVDLANLAKFLVSFAKSLNAGMKGILNDHTHLPMNSRGYFRNLQRLSERHHTLAETEGETYWPGMLSLHAQTYLHSSESEQQETARYFALGRRRYGNALGRTEEHPSPHFGLSDTGLFIQLTAPDERVLRLREMAYLFSGRYNLDGAIIRLKHPEGSLGYQIIEYATLFPQAVEGTSHKIHRRWIVFPKTTSDILDIVNGHFTATQKGAIDRSIAIMSGAEPCGLLGSGTFIDHKDGFTWVNKKAPLSLQYIIDQTSWADPILPAKQRSQGWHIGHSKHTFGNTDYQCFYGDSSRAAVFCSDLGWRAQDPPCALPTNYVIRALENGDLDLMRLINHFSPLFLPQLMESASTYFQSLMSFAHADHIYGALSQAEIDLSVFAKTLCDSNWAQALLKETNGKFTRTISLSCASFFDTGYLDLRTEDLEDVLALSSANSIYASEFLFCDPSRRPPDYRLRHVIGNVGKPGLALLLSPRNTILREPDIDTWQLVNHAKFDGCFEDNFPSTTLHLSLTGYEQRLNTSRYGCRDKEAFYLEAAVKAYDKGAWFADLDLLHLLHDPFLHVGGSCLHNSSAQQDFSDIHDPVSIDNWHEYLERPPNTAVIRASGNWVARLAFAAIPLADKEELIIVSEMMCWACLMDELNHVTDERLILC